MMMNQLSTEKLTYSKFSFIILTARMGKHTVFILFPCAGVELEFHLKIRSQYHSILHSHLYDLLTFNTCC